MSYLLTTWLKDIIIIMDTAMWIANHVIKVTSLIAAHTDTMSHEGCAKENIVFQPQTTNHKSQINAH